MSMLVTFTFENNLEEGPWEVECMKALNAFNERAYKTVSLIGCEQGDSFAHVDEDTGEITRSFEYTMLMNMDAKDAHAFKDEYGLLDGLGEEF